MLDDESSIKIKFEVGKNDSSAGEIAMLAIIAFILGVGMTFTGFFSILLAAPRKALHPEVALLQIKYLFYGSIFLMLTGLVLTILGLRFI